MEIEIPKPKTFDLPQGKFRARLVEIKALSNQNRNRANGEQMVRLLFEVQVKGKEGYICMAGRNFPVQLSEYSALRTFLEAWLGPTTFSKNTGKKFNLDDCLNKEALIELEHIHDDKYQRPLIVIQNIEPLIVPGDVEGPAIEEPCKAPIQIPVKNDPEAEERKAA